MPVWGAGVESALVASLDDAKAEVLSELGFSKIRKLFPNWIPPQILTPPRTVNPNQKVSRSVCAPGKSERH